MKRSTDRILTTHVGSLVRPPALIDAMRRLDAGDPLPQPEYETLLRDSVRDVVRAQASKGVDVPSDGEFGKRGWTGYVVERLSGVEPRLREGVFAPGWGRDRRDYSEFYAEYDKIQRAHWLPPESTAAVADRSARMGTAMSWCAVGPLGYKGGDLLQRDIANFKAGLAAAGLDEGFMPVAAPGSAIAGRLNEHYTDEASFLYALSDALSVEYHTIADAGLLLQVDDAFLPTEYDRIDFDGDMAAYRRFSMGRIEALNHALQGIPLDRVRYHVCWGSWNGPHSSDVPLRDIVDLVLQVNAGAYAIEAANPAHEHEWEVWQAAKLPDGVTLIPGVVTHSTHVLEHPELVAQRLERFANLVGKENLMAGTDCGFSQNWDLIRTHVTVQWAKLRALAEGARIASERLWRK
jgi:5-methyltetrahydropteroyltriglutamate--homocysteine methyltransferase